MLTTERLKHILAGTAITTGTADAYVENSLSDTGGGLSVAQVGDLVVCTDSEICAWVKTVTSDTVLALKDAAGANTDLAFPEGSEAYSIYPVNIIDMMENDTNVKTQAKVWLAEYQTKLASGTTRGDDRQFAKYLAGYIRNKN